MSPIRFLIMWTFGCFLGLVFYGAVMFVGRRVAAWRKRRVHDTLNAGLAESAIPHQDYGRRED